MKTPALFSFQSVGKKGSMAIHRAAIPCAAGGNWQAGCSSAPICRLRACKAKKPGVQAAQGGNREAFNAILQLGIAAHHCAHYWGDNLGRVIEVNEAISWRQPSARCRESGYRASRSALRLFGRPSCVETGSPPDGAPGTSAHQTSVFLCDWLWAE